MKKYKLVKAHHPNKFEEGVYAVHFQEQGKPFLDRYSLFTMLKAKNRRDAIKKAKIKFGID